MNVQYHRLTDAGFAYAVRTPERMRAGLPMIVQLHGAGERGGGEELWRRLRFMDWRTS